MDTNERPQSTLKIAQRENPNLDDPLAWISSDWIIIVCEQASVAKCKHFTIVSSDFEGALAHFTDIRDLVNFLAVKCLETDFIPVRVLTQAEMMTGDVRNTIWQQFLEYLDTNTPYRVRDLIRETCTAIYYLNGSQ